MKKLKSSNLLFFARLLMAIFTMGCGEDREVVENTDYVVDIEIVSPANNATLNVGESFNVEVDYARAENIIHNIKVEILDANGEQVQKLVERHAHVANEFTFKMEDIQIDQAGTYTVRAATTDLHDGEHGEGEHSSHESGGHDKMENVVEHTITVQ
ncbi:MAG: hypothetical protein AAGJ18_25920 [Bacteroidota bacterium]